MTPHPLGMITLFSAPAPEAPIQALISWQRATQSLRGIEARMHCLGIGASVHLARSSRAMLGWMASDAPPSEASGVDRSWRRCREAHERGSTTQGSCACNQPEDPPHTHTRHHLHNKEALLSRTLQHPVTQLYVPWSLPSPDLRGYPNSEPPPYGQEEEMPLSSIKQNKTKSCQSCQGEEETLVKTGHGYCHSCLCAVAQNWPEEPPANPGAWLRPGWNIHPGLTGR